MMRRGLSLLLAVCLVLGMVSMAGGMPEAEAAAEKVRFREVYTNGRTTAAIGEDGSLYMWGSNFTGQVGNGTTEDQTTPEKVLSDVVSVSLGGSTTAAITEDGSLYMWGSNFTGQVGNGTTENQTTP